MAQQIEPSNSQKDKLQVIHLIIAIIITTLIVGSGIYLWQKTAFEKEKQELRQLINQFQSQINQSKKREETTSSAQIEKFIKIPIDTSRWEMYRDEKIGLIFRYPREWGKVEEEKLQIHGEYPFRHEGDLVKYRFSNKEGVYFGAKTNDFYVSSSGIYLINEWERDITNKTCDLKVKYKPLITLGCKQVSRGGMGITEKDLTDQEGYLLPWDYEEFYTGMSIYEYRSGDPVLSKHYIISNNSSKIYRSIVFTYDFDFPKLADYPSTTYSIIESALIKALLEPREDILIFDAVVDSVRLIP